MEDNSKKDLKIIALREALRDRVAEITTTYEDRIVDLRIQITEQGQTIDTLTAENESLRNSLAQKENDVLEENAATSRA